MRWSEIRRHPYGASTVRLLRRETLLEGPYTLRVLVPRRRWRVEVREPASAKVLLETRVEADAWEAYRRASGDGR